MKSLGLTLMELIVVIAIIALIIAIMIPVVNNARYRAKDTTCINNMRQILQAVALYRADYSQQFPHRTRAILSYVKTPQIFQCPADLQNGITLLRDSEIPGLSYYYFLQTSAGRFILEHGSKHDPNHGILACIWHPISNIQWAKKWSAAPLPAPYVRRGLLDGSVHTVRKRAPNPDETRTPGSPFSGHYGMWVLFTDAPCPQEYCLNGAP